MNFNLVQTHRKTCVSIVIAAIALGACRTADKDEKAKILDGEESAPALGPDDGAPVPVPAFLWSPARRRATAGYYYLVGEYMAMEGKFKNARPVFEFAYSLDPNPFLGAKLVATEAGLGDVDKALPEAKKLVLLYPKSAQLHFLYGQLLAQKGAYEDAAHEVQRAVSLEGSREEYYVELANIYTMTKAFPKAIAVVNGMLKQHPQSIPGLVKLAKLYLASNQKKQALAPAQKAYELENNNPEIVLIYALALESNDQSKKALGVYEQLYRMDPTNEELIGRMIDLYRSLGDLKESLELLNELAELPGGHRPGIELQRAILLWELKRFEEAARLLESLAKENPQQDRLQYMAGLGQEKIKKYAEALKYFAAVPESSQFNQHAKFRSAVILKEQGKLSEALTFLEPLKEFKDGAEDVYFLIANVLGDMDRYGEAIDVLAEGYEKFPDKARLLFLKGVFQEKNKDIDGCIATMRAVIAADPENSAAYNYLGYLFAERNENLGEAEQLIRRALELKPDDGYYLDSLAWVFYQRKDYKTALKYLQQAAEKVPGEGVVLEHFGDVYKALAEHQKALEFYEKAAASRLEERDEERIKAKLQAAKSDAAKPGSTK